MSEMKVYIKNSKDEVETLYSYCNRLSKRNNSILYKLENHLNMKLLDDESLVEIRDIILTVSADISKINNHIIIIGDNDEEL